MAYGRGIGRHLEGNWPPSKAAWTPETRCGHDENVGRCSLNRGLIARCRKWISAGSTREKGFSVHMSDLHPLPWVGATLGRGRKRKQERAEGERELRCRPSQRRPSPWGAFFSLRFLNLDERESQDLYPGP